jgi:hypothetical protein
MPSVVYLDPSASDGRRGMVNRDSVEPIDDVSRSFEPIFSSGSTGRNRPAPVEKGWQAIGFARSPDRPASMSDFRHAILRLAIFMRRESRRLEAPAGQVADARDRVSYLAASAE